MDLFFIILIIFVLFVNFISEFVMVLFYIGLNIY